MKTVWKFSLPEPGVDLHLQIDAEAEVVHVGLDPTGHPCIWAIVDLDPEAVAAWMVVITGTGQPAPDGDYLGLFMQGPFVWHVWRVR